MLPFLFLVSFFAAIYLILMVYGRIYDFRTAKTITKNLDRFISYEEFYLVIVGLNLNPFKVYSSVAFDKYIKFLDPLTKQLFIYLNIDFNNSNKSLHEDFYLKLETNFNLDKLSVEDVGILVINKLPSIVSLSMGFDYSLENPPTGGSNIHNWSFPVITTSPPHSTQLIGLKLKETLNIKWIADLRDPWTDIYYYKSMLHTKWAKRKDLNYEKAVIEKSDKIVVVSDSIKQLLINKSNLIQESKIHVIPNGFDEEDFSVSSTNKNNKFLLSYVGTITKDYPLDSIKKSITNLILILNLLVKLTIQPNIY